ncbi:hypothetical protein ACPCTO_23760 [Streptomyces olivoreticuli]
MRTVKRAATAFAASLLLTIGAAALAAPAHAEVDANLLGNLLTEHANGSEILQLGGATILNTLNPLSPIV